MDVELLKCIDGCVKQIVSDMHHSTYVIKQFADSNISNSTYDNRDAYGIVLNKVPGLDSIMNKGLCQSEVFSKPRARKQSAILQTNSKYMCTVYYAYHYY